MYSLIENLIDHEYVSNYGGDQQYIYMICGALIIVITAVVIDLIYRGISHFWK